MDHVPKRILTLALATPLFCHLTTWPTASSTRQRNATSTACKHTHQTARQAPRMHLVFHDDAHQTHRFGIFDNHVRQSKLFTTFLEGNPDTTKENHDTSCPRTDSACPEWHLAYNDLASPMSALDIQVFLKALDKEKLLASDTISHKRPRSYMYACTYHLAKHFLCPDLAYTVYCRMSNLKPLCDLIKSKPLLCEDTSTGSYERRVNVKHVRRCTHKLFSQIKVGTKRGKNVRGDLEWINAYLPIASDILKWYLCLTYFDHFNAITKILHPTKTPPDGAPPLQNFRRVTRGTKHPLHFKYFSMLATPEHRTQRPVLHDRTSHIKIHLPHAPHRSTMHAPYGGSPYEELIATRTEKKQHDGQSCHTHENVRYYDLAQCKNHIEEWPFWCVSLVAYTVSKQTPQNKHKRTSLSQKERSHLQNTLKEAIPQEAFRRLCSRYGLRHPRKKHYTSTKKT